MQPASKVLGTGSGTKKNLPSQPFGWQVIVVQARGRCKPNAKPTPLQATISYGDTKESTPILVERQPLWNFWAQMPDQGGQEQMVFSVLERDKATESMTVKGEVRVDLSQYRLCGKSFEIWERLIPKAQIGAMTAPELHLTISYSAKKDTLESDTDCIMCSWSECVIS